MEKEFSSEVCVIQLGSLGIKYEYEIRLYFCAWNFLVDIVFYKSMVDIWYFQDNIIRYIFLYWYLYCQVKFIINVYMGDKFNIS